MSSNEDDGEGPHGSKKRRVQRACDICRRKKSDGLQTPGTRCANCSTYGLQCTYVETAKKRGPSKRYVEGLEDKVQKMSKLLRRLCPDESVYHSILNAMEKDDGTRERESLDSNSLMGIASPSQSQDTSPSLLDTITRSIRGSHLGQTTTGGDEDDFGIVLEDLKGLAIEPCDGPRFFGKSSGAMLVQRLIQAKRDYAGPNQPTPSLSLRYVRPEFWIIPDWERSTRVIMSSRNFDFPPADLAEELIDHYFRNVNLYLPLLHRPTFEEGVKANLHHTEVGFDSVYMLVCSLGAKFSDDPRVKLDGEESSHSAGWKWFNQTILTMKTPMSPATLYDIQSYALAVQFLGASASPQNCWTLIGIALRVAQDVGAHRKRPRTRSAAQHESWNRSFWILYVLDRFLGASLGRPCAIHEEDFDLDLPSDCNDEYWNNEDPAKCFQQPAGVPSRITAFILLIKLMRILSLTLRTVYAINKSKMNWYHQGRRWEETVVAELDSAMNSWVDLVPTHLRWDPNREDKELFDQSVMLYSNYYFLQIIVHRPFIPTPTMPSPSSFPSLSICANAARSCSHLADVQRRRTRLAPITQMPVCTAAIILLLNLWSGKKSGLSAEVVKKDMGDVLMCMEAMKSVEKRWQAAGRLWDLLYELAYVGDLPLPEPKPTSSNKRPRGSNGLQDPYQNKEVLPNGNRNIAGSRRAQQFSRQDSPGSYQHTSPGSASSPSEPSVDSPSIVSSSLQSSQCENFHLPMYSKELGQLPLHGPFKPHPQSAIPTTSASADPGRWYPTYLENTGVEQLSMPAPYSGPSGSSLPHRPFTSHTGLFGDMSSLAGDGPSEPVVDLGMDPMRGSGYSIALERFLQAPSAFNVPDQDGTFHIPSDPEISAQPPRQQMQWQQQLENLLQMNTGTMGPQGIDLGTMNSDVMSMWLNPSPSLLMEDWNASFATLGHAPPNRQG